MPKNAWSSTDIEMIRFVKQHPIIYDPPVNSADRNVALKILWNEFAKTTDISAQQCATRWRAIAGRYKYRTMPHSSKFYDGSLSFLDHLVQKKERPKSLKYEYVYHTKLPPAEPSTTPEIRKTWTKEMLLNTRVVTQDMISELIKLKTEEERNSPKIASNKTDTLIKLLTLDKQLEPPDPEGTKLEVTHNVTKELQTYSLDSDSPCNHYGVTQSPYLQETVTIENDQENNIISTNKDSQSTEYCSKEANDKLKINTIEFFEDLGTYVSNHFPDKQQKQLRLMLWSLITEEEMGITQED